MSLIVRSSGVVGSPSAQFENPGSNSLTKGQKNWRQRVERLPKPGKGDTIEGRKSSDFNRMVAMVDLVGIVWIAGTIATCALVGAGWGFCAFIIGFALTTGALAIGIEILSGLKTVAPKDPRYLEGQLPEMEYRLRRARTTGDIVYSLKIDRIYSEITGYIPKIYPEVNDLLTEEIKDAVIRNDLDRGQYYSDLEEIRTAELDKVMKEAFEARDKRRAVINANLAARFPQYDWARAILPLKA